MYIYIYMYRNIYIYICRKIDHRKCANAVRAYPGGNKYESISETLDENMWPTTKARLVCVFGPPAQLYTRYHVYT